MSLSSIIRKLENSSTLWKYFNNIITPGFLLSLSRQIGGKQTQLAANSPPPPLGPVPVRLFSWLKYRHAFNCSMQVGSCLPYWTAWPVLIAPPVPARLARLVLEGVHFPRFYLQGRKGGGVPNWWSIVFSAEVLYWLTAPADETYTRRAN